MVIFTPQDRRSSVWTQDRPSAQVQPYTCPEIIFFFNTEKKGPSQAQRTMVIQSCDFSVSQILQQLVILAAEALPVLERQLMDPRGPGDIRVSIRLRVNS